MVITRRCFLQTTAVMGAGISAMPLSNAQEKPVYRLGRSTSYTVPAACTKPTGLKIKKIETFLQDGTVAFVGVTMDDGSQGWGQISTYDADIVASILHRKVASIALGQDPAEWDNMVDLCIEKNYKWPWSYVCRAIGGLDTALFDWFGKREGKSVCELLGGQPKSLPVYGSSMRRDITPKDEAERLLRLQGERGYKAFKVRVGVENGRDGDKWPGRTEELIPTIRKALGDNIHLMADGNSGYSPSKAIQVGKRMQDNGYSFFEEPCPYWELEWTAEVASKLDIPISGGEQDNDLAQFRRMIAMNAVDIVQPDILYVGGILRTLRVAALAAEAGKPCVPHSANRAMVTVFTLHMMGAIPNAGQYVEYSIEPTPWADALFHPTLTVKDGTVAIPDGPGWGVTINADWLAQATRQVSEK
jgi:L-alanine-DL-glutamate epimerase-like enolase superfamily enzyme